MASARARDPQDDALLAEALALAAEGRAVVDVAPRAKAPRGAGWQRRHYAEADIRRVWGAPPVPSIGIRLGEPSRWLIDVDVDAAEARAAAPLLLPATSRQHGRASSPNSHFWYIAEGAETVRLRAPDGAVLVELRSTGAQTVVPPSIHPSGEPYVYSERGEPARVEARELLGAVRRLAAAALLARSWPAQGSRHDAALALAGMLLRGGMGAEDAERIVGAVSLAAGDHERHDRVRAVRDTAAALARGDRATGGRRLAELLRDGERVVRQAAEWLGLRDVRADATAGEVVEPLDLWADGVAGTPELPEGVAPAVVESWARDVARRVGSDPAIGVLAGLTVCAAAIDDGHRLQVRANDTGWTESARLWVAPVAPSGAGKSPTMAAMLAPLRAIDLERSREDAPRLSQWEREHAAWERVVRRHAEQRAEGRDPGTDPPEPPRPRRRRRLAEDVTVEALSDVLRDQETGVVVAVDELVGFITSHDAYRDAGTGRDRALYLEAYEGRPKLIERVRRGSVYVPAWSVSILGGIQPGPMRRLVGRVTDDGLLQRMLVAYACECDAGVDARPDYMAESAYRSLVARLVDLPAPREPYRLASEAHAVREAVEAIARAVSVLPTTPESLKGALAKYPATFARLALIDHVVEAVARGETPAGTVSRATCERAARLLTDYLLPHAARLHAELAGDDRAEHTRWIAGYVLAHRLERITARDVYRVRRELRGEPGEIARVMAPLEVAGWVASESVGYGVPSRWRVNPRVHGRFAARAETERLRRARERERVLAAVRTVGLAREDDHGAV